VRIAVTGATGFVGASAVRHLAAAGHEIVAFGRRPPDDPAALALVSRRDGPAPRDGAAAAFDRATPTDAVTYRRWDITRPLADAPHVDAVVHCAAEVAGAGPLWRATAVNIGGTRHVLAAFADAPRFVHLSSASVYGVSPARGARPHREDDPLPAASAYPGPYGATKAAAERLVLAADRAAVILRPRAVYGPGDTTLLPRLLAARHRDTLVLPGDGTNRVSVTAIGNLLLAIDRALAYPGGGVFNVADADAPTLAALLGAVFAALDLPTRLLFLPAPPLACAALVVERAWHLLGRPGEPSLTRYAVAQLSRPCLLDLTRARTLLGYVPRPERAATLAALAASRPHAP